MFDIIIINIFHEQRYTKGQLYIFYLQIHIHVLSISTLQFCISKYAQPITKKNDISIISTSIKHEYIAFEMQQISQTSLTILKVTALNGRIFPRFSAITPFYLSLNGKPIVSGRNAIGETKKKKRKKKRYVSKRRVKRCIFKLFALVRKTTGRNVGQSGKINHRATESRRREKERER